MRKIIAFFMLLFVFTNAYAFIDRGNAIITVLDKAAGKTYTMTIPVENDVKYEKLNLNVRACKQTDPFMPENAYMFIEITNNNNEKIFSGWMNKNAPGENPLQNADYDIWLVRCE